jgi:hypothetical protein
MVAMSRKFLAASAALACIVAASAPDANAESGRLGYTAGRPSVPLGRPGRTLGQPTTGLAPERRQIGVDQEVQPLADPKPRDLRPVRIAPSTTQFFGSGGKAKDGSVPGGSLVALTEAERSKVREIILSQNAAEDRRVTFKLIVGAKIPENVSLRPIPPEAVDVVPKYKDFDFTIVKERIVVVQRSTREIDTMIPF